MAFMVGKIEDKDRRYRGRVECVVVEDGWC